MPGAAVAADDDVPDVSLERCAAIESEDERLACFDELARATGARAGQEPAEKPAASSGQPDARAAAAPEAGTSTRPLGDDVGREALDSDDGRFVEIYTGTLVRCEDSGRSNRAYFFFDNGQVWRQSNAERLRVRDCSGSVELTRDFFGYKLNFPDDNISVRVRRVR